MPAKAIIPTSPSKVATPSWVATLCTFILHYTIPAEHLVKLPNPLLLETLMYVDDKGNEWVAAFATEEGTRKKLYEVWIKNGESIAYEMYID